MTQHRFFHTPVFQHLVTVKMNLTKQVKIGSQLWKLKMI